MRGTSSRRSRPGAPVSKSEEETQKEGEQLRLLVTLRKGLCKHLCFVQGPGSCYMLTEQEACTRVCGWVYVLASVCSMCARVFPHLNVGRQSLITFGVKEDDF